MILNEHTKLGIAQTIFYAPILPLSLWLLKRNGRYSPRMAWLPICVLSTMRLVGGPLVIAFQWHTSEGLAIATTVLLNIGTVPLVATNLGLARAIFLDNYKPTTRSERLDMIAHFFLAPPAALLAAGGGLRTSQPSLSHILTLVGYILYAVLLILILGTELCVWRRARRLIHSSHVLLTSSFIAAPFVALRIAYGILEVAFISDVASIWSPLAGSAAAFALMALLPEYIAIIIYMAAGFSIPADRGVAQALP